MIIKWLDLYQNNFQMAYEIRFICPLKILFFINNVSLINHRQGEQITHQPKLECTQNVWNLPTLLWNKLLRYDPIIDIFRKSIFHSRWSSTTMSPAARRNVCTRRVEKKLLRKRLPTLVRGRHKLSNLWNSLSSFRIF